MNYRHSAIPDLFLTLPIIFLLSLGILVIFSSDIQLAIQQLIIALIGLAIYWLISLTDVETYESYIQYLYWGTVILLGIVFIVGIETRGSTRWIPIGSLHLQPSEFIKPMIILLLAKFWSTHHPNWLNIGKSLLLIIPSLVLIFKQPDLGTTLIILAIWLLMLIGANTSLKKIIVMSTVSLISIPIVWLLMKDYQKDRIISFLSPEKDPLGVGYNVIQSTIAVGSGQMAGRGLGRGTQSRLQFLPEFRTDFIFASIAEEFGFIGSLLVLILYGSLLVRCLRLISLCTNKMGSLIIFGVSGMLFFQVIVNIGMNIGIMPITGITLPLVSYGGSSLLAILICLGLVASTRKYCQKRALPEAFD